MTITYLFDMQSGNSPPNGFLRQYRLFRAMQTTSAVFGAVLIFTAPLSVDHFLLYPKYRALSIVFRICFGKEQFAGLFLCTFIALFSVLPLSGCKNEKYYHDELKELYATVSVAETSETENLTQSSETALVETTEQVTKNTEKTTLKTETAAPPETTSAKTEKTTVTETAAEKLSVEKDGSYTTPEDVAEYIHTFGTLPKNFITKSEAKALGWDNKKGNLWDVAEGKSIGGDYFGNYEGLLPRPPRQREDNLLK